MSIQVDIVFDEDDDLPNGPYAELKGLVVEVHIKKGATFGDVKVVMERWYLEVNKESVPMLGGLGPRTKISKFTTKGMSLP
eukprot:CAMPEP_0174272762 /NCGR_PEP_ID=MMETSP0439-20130205/52404_1 /TAXON_ID=0 /ORGANISM="Stereomyxa ramosa, Strain Chinc5" /LENGTH=80 /DNA_ID=CAMNT_0015363531 /DNA_START=58 /DNA_END=296 /DNA_ORIENTATION=-